LITAYDADINKNRGVRLDSLCRQRGLSRAEGLRQALRSWLDHQGVQHQSVFGLWRNRPEDSLRLERALRSEWER
jgi:hypothetical protein